MKVARLMAVLGLAALTLAPANAQTYPDRPIKWMVPYAAGGNADGFTRALAKKMQETIGQSFVIENRPGGDTIIGTAHLVQSAPDGYNIGFISDSLGIHAAGGRKTPYDYEKDLVPIAQLAMIPFTLVVGAETVPAKTLPELIAWAKANPEALTFATIGPGSPHEMGFKWFQHFAGIKAAYVPYRGVAPALQDLVAGQVKSMFFGGVIGEEWVKAGKIRRIAVTNPSRVAAAPEAMAIAELYPEYTHVSWYGVAAPAGTPRAIIDRLNREANAALASKEVRDIIATYGFLPAGGTPEQLAEAMRVNREKFARLFAQTGIKLPQ